MQKALEAIGRWIWWVMNIRLWQFILGVVIVALVVTGIWYYRTLPGRNLVAPESDTPIDGIPHYDKPIDIFRARWDIYGRFEAWPPLLPLAEMSNEAYLSESKAKGLFQKFGFVDPVVSVNSPFHSHVAYVVRGEDVVCIVFRGTDDIEDWVSSVNIYPRRMPEGLLHAGFASAYAAVRCEIWQEVEKHDPKHIWITGHSLGGAMALICAYDLAVYRGRHVDGVITFGQPRIVKQNLATFLQEILGDRYVHFVNEQDGVPRSPPGFCECGLMLRFLNGQVMKSRNYFRSMATTGTKRNELNKSEYVPVDGLPEMSREEFDDFIRHYRQEERPGPPQFTNGPKAVGSPLSLKRDHAMNLYVEKIRSAIETAHRKKQGP